MLHIGWRTVLWLGIAVGAAGVARAEDPAEEGSPGFGGTHVALTKDALLPEGWRLQEPSSPRPEGEKALATAIREAGATVPGLDVLDPILHTLSGPGGKIASVAVVDADEKVKEVSAALEALAKKNNWAFRELGARSRLLLLDAPVDVRDALVAAHVRWAAEALARHALDSARVGADTERVKSVLARALALAPKNAHAHSYSAQLALDSGNGEHPDPKSIEPALAHLRTALASDADYPLPDFDTLDAKSMQGLLLLEQKGHDKEARDALLAVADSPKAKEYKGVWLALYNLACAHARLGEKDLAFQRLTTLLEHTAKESRSNLDSWTKDEDFNSLHEDPRWKALVEKYPPHGTKDDGGG